MSYTDSVCCLNKAKILIETRNSTQQMPVIRPVILFSRDGSVYRVGATKIDTSCHS